MTRPDRTFLLVAMLAVLAAGCGGAPGEKAASGPPGRPGSKYDAGPRAGETPADDARAEVGEDLFSAKGCTACHAMGRRLTGPDLAGVSMRRTQAWLEHQILDPAGMTKDDPIARELMATHALQMPNQGLTPDEAKAVIEYFKHEDQEAGLKPVAAK
jgi:mono/diheme cytochrome c family protein